MPQSVMLDQRKWLGEYFERYRAPLFQSEVIPQLIQLKDIVKKAQENGGKVIFAGNGGSAAIASHCAVDFTKNAGIRSMQFNEASFITCFANDFGYEHWLGKALEFHADEGDVVILISSSGRSKNMIWAGQTAQRKKLKLVTFTGFESDNPLRQLGDLNLWVSSRSYNIVEMIHQIWILAVCDLVIGRAEYPAAPSRGDQS
jgi:D-sedoheptulose 7-phosphate isomerase